jgi:hypothetical protein
MIDALFVPLRDELKSLGVPFELEYGPAPVPPKVGATRIILFADPEKDQILAPRGRTTVPPMIAVRRCAGYLLVHAQSGVTGARLVDHQELVGRVVDKLQCCLHAVVGRAKTLWQATSSGFVRDESTDGWKGSAYKLSFWVDRGVYRTTWVGDADGEMTMTAHTAQTAVTATGPDAATALPTVTTRIDS